MKQVFLERPAVFRFKRFSRKSYAVFASFRELTIGVLTSCILLLADATNLPAQTPSKARPGIDTEHELDEVKVTASRIELPVSQTVKHLTVISREEISGAPIQSIQDLLNYVAGIDLVQRGGHGVQADISIRGGSFDQTAILLNGVNVSNPQTGHYSMDLPVNLDDIERIEILYGPSSFVYGASALSGGINIITRKSPRHKAYARIQAGEHSLAGAEGNLNLQSKEASHQLSAGYSQSDGYTANSDYNQLKLLWQTRLLIDHSTLDLQAGYNDKSYGANTFYSPRYPNQYDATESYLASVKWQTGSRLKFSPTLYWNRHNDRFELIRGDESKVKFNHHQTDVYGSNLNFQYSSGWGTTAFGSEVRNEGIRSSVLGNPLATPQGKYTKSFNRTQISYMLEHTLTLDRLSMTAGLMLNHNTQIAGEYKFYPTAGLAFTPSSHWKLYASWSKATRMPTFTDLFYDSPTHTGNPNLKPEESQSFNLGVDYRHEAFSAYLSGHVSRGKNMIDWVKEDVKWKAYNHSSLDKMGIEAGAKIVIGRWITFLSPLTSLQAGYARLHQSGDRIAEDQSSHYALNYLRDKLTAQLFLPLYKDRLTSHWNFRWQHRMGAYDDYGQGDKAIRTPFPAFSTLDLRLEYKITQALVANIDINNLYDTHYFDLGSIPQAGFWLMGSIRYTFETK